MIHDTNYKLKFYCQSGTSTETLCADSTIESQFFIEVDNSSGTHKIDRTLAKAALAVEGVLEFTTNLKKKLQYVSSLPFHAYDASLDLDVDLR